MENYIFEDFFNERDNELAATVEHLFEAYFAEAYNSDENPGQVSKTRLSAVIEEKFAGDDNLMEMLNSEIEKVMSPEAGDEQNISDMQVKSALRVIIMKQQQLFINEADVNDALIAEI